MGELIEMKKHRKAVDSFGVSFVNSVGALSLFLRGKRYNADAVEYARNAMIEILEEYKKREYAAHEPYYQWIDGAIERMPALSGAGNEYATVRIQQQLRKLYTFEGGCYEEQCLPQIFIAMLEKEIQV